MTATVAEDVEFNPSDWCEEIDEYDIECANLNAHYGFDTPSVDQPSLDIGSETTEDDTQDADVSEIDVITNDIVLSDCGINPESHVPLEVSVNDVNELAVVQKFYGSECAACCSLRCNKKIPKELALSRRQAFQELDKTTQDSVILHVLQCHRRLSFLNAEYGKDTKRGGSRVSTAADVINRYNVGYFFADIRVCRMFFFFLYDIGIRRYTNLLHHYDSEGLAERVHKSTRKIPKRKNVLPVADIENVVQFIREYAEQYAIPLPGRVANFRNYKVVLLPSASNKAVVHRKYQESMKLDINEELNEDSETAPLRCVEYSTFTEIWRKYVPWIVTSKPAEDLCGTCRENTRAIMKSVGQNDAKKDLVLLTARQHLQDASDQREFYNTWRHRASNHETFVFNETVNTCDDTTERKFEVLSFNFAEQVHYPSSSRPIGSEYFKSARKCGIFGIHDERTHRQTNYLIDEADSIGKGANVVINLLHHYLAQVETDVIILFADNCVGQNKNHAVMQYLMWRVLTKLNMKIELHFMIAGHTKFSPDRGFGLLKYHYSRSDVDCLEDLVHVVNTSSHKGYNVAVPTVLQGHRNVIWYAWPHFLQNYFVKFPSITTYHRFEFNADGYISVGKLANSELERIPIQSASLETAEALVIEEILPTPLTPARQWYLYLHIRGLCQDPTKADSVGPKPLIPKPTGAGQNVFRKAKVEMEEAGPSTSTPKPKRERGSKRKNET